MFWGRLRFPLSLISTFERPVALTGVKMLLQDSQRSATQAGERDAPVNTFLEENRSVLVAVLYRSRHSWGVVRRADSRCCDGADLGAGCEAELEGRRSSKCNGRNGEKRQVQEVHGDGETKKLGGEQMEAEEVRVGGP